MLARLAVCRRHIAGVLQPRRFFALPLRLAFRRRFDIVVAEWERNMRASARDNWGGCDEALGRSGGKRGLEGGKGRYLEAAGEGWARQARIKGLPASTRLAMLPPATLNKPQQ